MEQFTTSFERVGPVWFLRKGNNGRNREIAVKHDGNQVGALQFNLVDAYNKCEEEFIALRLYKLTYTMIRSTNRSWPFPVDSSV